MAYEAGMLAVLNQTIEGSFSLFLYVTSDTPAEVLAPGYFSDGAVRGMDYGDLIVVLSNDVPYFLYCSGISGESCTVSSINGTSPFSEFLVTSNKTLLAPGTYYINTSSAITLTIGSATVGGDIIIVDVSGNPNVTISGTVLNSSPGLTFSTPWFVVRFVWSNLLNGNTVQ